MAKWASQMAAIMLLFTTTGTQVHADVSPCHGQLASVTPFSRETTSLKENAVWVKDPLQVSDRVYYMGYEKFLTRQLYEFATTADMVEGQPPETFYSLPHTVEGTGFLVYDRNLYYNPEGTRSLVRFDLVSQTVAAVVELTNANYDGISPYGTELSTDIDLAVDESGLWAIYATEQNSGNIVISRLLHENLETVQTWATDYYKLSALNAFIVCGTLYTVDYASLRIDYMFDTISGLGKQVDIVVPGLTRTTASINYNPKDEMLYVWDNSMASTYTLDFKPFTTTPPPTTTKPATTTVSTTTTTTTRLISTRSVTTVPVVPVHIQGEVLTTQVAKQTTTMQEKESTSSVVHVVTGEKNLVILRVVLGGSLGLVVVAGVIILYCVLIPQRPKRYSNCCPPMPWKQPPRRYPYTTDYPGTGNGTLRDSLYLTGAGNVELGFDGQYGPPIGQTTTLLPVSGAQHAFLMRRPDGAQRPARSLSEMDVLRVTREEPGCSMPLNEGVGQGVVQHCQLQDNCFCGSHFQSTRCGTMPAKSRGQINGKQLRLSDGDASAACRVAVGICPRDARVSLLRSEGRPHSEHYHRAQGVFLDNITSPIPLNDYHPQQERILHQLTPIPNHDSTIEDESERVDARYQQQQQFPTATSGYSTNQTQSSDSPDSYDSLPPRRPRIRMGTSDLPVLGSTPSWERDQRSRTHRSRSKRSSDPMSTDQGYVTDGQNPDGSPDGPSQYSRYPNIASSTQFSEPADRISPIVSSGALEACRELSSALSAERCSDNSDAASENDLEVERIISSKDLEGRENSSLECNLTMDDYPDDIIDTAVGGRISEADTTTSWSAQVGPNLTSSPCYPLALPATYRTDAPGLKAISPPRLHRSPVQSHLYTLPGTASAKTTAKINLKTGAVNMITNL